jgi:subtilisin family serine protease
MTVNALEWGIANINADDVWSQFGVQGEGITIANIDTGVQFDHPALVSHYRGTTGNGTFDHNYNWFDATDNCPAAPCDLNGHGTHTMGTMVGDDGAGNQVGVAPGAKWIAANGCCPNDQALIASGEWLLAPRDLAGNNPDPSRRPNIINNSWGTQVPSNDPFMEDVLTAWKEAGIFAVFSNGNIGSGCESSGAPGSRTLAYSVGAYDINNTIGGFSSRGPGQDGTMKPNISAPGVNVRSSVPGNAYANFQGTSMAAPHVAGSVALLWSAAPALIGDVDETRALLDETAVDTEDLQCGGTADDNNVYGEGRLDALALLQAAPIGSSGRLEGAVTDAITGDPVAGADVTIDGPIDRRLTTGPDGTYGVPLSVGDYTVTVSDFGYDAQTKSATVSTDTTTTVDFAMEPAARITVSGRVGDGSGQGWPLYAKVTAVGVPIDPVYTGPLTGTYSIELPAGPSYELTIASETPGYESRTVTVDAGGGDITLDVDLTIDAALCKAGGYEFRHGVDASFDDMRLPRGWSVVDHENEGEFWRFDDPLLRTNNTGGRGGFAITDYLVYGFPGSRNSSLVSPVMDLSDVADPTISYRTDYFPQPADRVVDVELSVDGGATWASVEHLAQPTNGARSIPIPQAAGEPDVQARWHWQTVDFSNWWQVDDVHIGEPECAPVDGGLVVGHVLDANTGDGVNGATVSSDARPGDTTTMATPGDDAVADGFFSLFSSQSGSQGLTAAKAGYTTTPGQVDVVADDVTEAEFELPAGRLVFEPATVDATLQLGQSSTRTLTVTNDGRTRPVRALSRLRPALRRRTAPGGSR